MLILQPHLFNNLEAKFGDKGKNKRVYRTPGMARLKLFALIMMKTSFDQICSIDTVLESERCCISSNILELICTTLLRSCQSVWIRQNWRLTLEC
jgi:hypothetical protein